MQKETDLQHSGGRTARRDVLGYQVNDAVVADHTRERLCDELRQMKIVNSRVLEVIYQIPRHQFVDEALLYRAWENTALPIGYGQTISQPYIVALMAELALKNAPLHRVLEVGTGCGYQAAVLSLLARQVYTIDRIDILVHRARERFYAMRHDNIRVMCGDGSNGWEEYAPFDAIIVSAAAAKVPDALLKQLAEAAPLIVPIGEDGGEQELLCITRTAKGYRQERLEKVSFVPLLEGVKKNE